MAISGSSRPCRVLVVENDRERVQELRTLFSQEGCECEVALDLETAVDIVSERRMEAVAVDLSTDGVDADEALDVLGKDESEHGLVFFNGSTDDSTQRGYRRKGADSYLSHKSSLKKVVNSTCRAMEEGA